MRVIALIAALALAGCQAEKPLVGGVVLNVKEIDLGLETRDPAKRYEDPLFPEVGWQVEVQLDDGSAVSVPHTGARRYEPGERVRLLRQEDGELLL